VDQGGDAEVTKLRDDDRFSKVFSDPRFMVAPNKMKKVEIDKRFKGMFKDKDFNVVAKVDKYGRKLKTRDNYALQNYYQKEGESDSDEDEGEAKVKKPVKKQSAKAAQIDAVGEKYYDKQGNFNW